MRSHVIHRSVELHVRLGMWTLGVKASLKNILLGLHKLCHPAIRDVSTWSKFGAHGEHGDVFLFSNLGAL